MFDIEPITSKNPLDCGPTCLQMLLAYYDIDVPLSTLVEECNVRRTGCTMGDLKRVAKLHGLSDANAYSCPASELYTQDRPSIIWWKRNHFCVYCGLDDDGLPVICNPDRGRYPMPQSSFESFYSGVELANGEPQDL